LKKKSKVILGCSLGLIIAGVIGAVNDSKGANEGVKPSSPVISHEVKKEPVKAVKTPNKETNKITKENYNKIKQGDTLTGKGGSTKAEVYNLLGKPKAESVSESVVGNEKTTMIVANWINKDFKSISVTFINDRVSAKMIIE
jgi:hypothetical protein